MKTMKKVLAVFLTLVMFVGMLPEPAVFAVDGTIEVWFYDLSDDSESLPST